MSIRRKSNRYRRGIDLGKKPEPEARPTTRNEPIRAIQALLGRLELMGAAPTGDVDIIMIATEWRGPSDERSGTLERPERFYPTSVPA